MPAAYRTFFYIAIRHMKFSLEDATVVARDFVRMPVGMFITVTDALNWATAECIVRNLLSSLISRCPMNEY